MPADESTSSLFLSPRSPKERRIWRFGTSGNAPTDGNPSDDGTLVLPVLLDRHESFSSFRVALAALTPHATSGLNADLARLRAYLDEAGASDLDNPPVGHTRFMTDAVTFAIMRRISRESVYTSRLIDLGARVLNQILAGMHGVRIVDLPSPERIDRPSLKIFARALLLLESTDEFSWVWSFSSDIFADDRVCFADDWLFGESRRSLCRSMLRMLSPSLDYRGNVSPFRPPPHGGISHSISDVSAALVLQNYDACFVWARTLSDRSEAARIQCLAAVNIGRTDVALKALTLAIAEDARPGRQAHICYLYGLIEAKRSYDLAASNEWYRQGLQRLETAKETNDEEDIPLERAWLLNGLALNEAIMWRRIGDYRRHNVAFSLVSDAFQLVRDGHSPARVYLRFNLMANSAFLMEMIGQYDLAIDVLSRGFDVGQEGSPLSSVDGRSTMGYRLALLHHRAGDQVQAARILAEAGAAHVESEKWPTRERILRAIGAVALRRQARDSAEEAFTEGLDLCRESRSAEGARYHAQCLVATLLLGGRIREARRLAEELLTCEALHTNISDWSENPSGPHSALLPAPSSKLPPYIPEIDLEEIPDIDMNRYLVRLPDRHPTEAAWKS